MATPTTLPASFTAGQVLTAAQMNGLRGAFRILQVVSTTKTDTFTTTSVSFVDVTGLTATITPSSTDSKIFVICQSSLGNSGATAVFLKMQGGTNGYIGDAAGSRSRITGQVYLASATEGEIATFSYVDSPASTSAQTYKLQIAAVTGQTACVNRRGTDTDTAATQRYASSITVMEISA